MIMNDSNYRLLYETSIRLELCSRYCTFSIPLSWKYSENRGYWWCLDNQRIYRRFFGDRNRSWDSDPPRDKRIRVSFTGKLYSEGCKKCEAKLLEFLQGLLAWILPSFITQLIIFFSIVSIFILLKFLILFIGSWTKLL